MAVPQQVLSLPTPQHAPNSGDHELAIAPATATSQPLRADPAPNELVFYPNPDAPPAAALLKRVDARGREIPALSTTTAWEPVQKIEENELLAPTPETAAYRTARQIVGGAAMGLPVLSLVDPAVNVLTIGDHVDRGDTAAANAELAASGIDTVFAFGGMMAPFFGGSRKAAKYGKYGKHAGLAHVPQPRIKAILTGQGSYSESVQLAIVRGLRTQFSPQIQFSVLKETVLNAQSNTVRQSAIAELFGNHVRDPAVAALLKDQRIVHAALQRTHFASFQLLPIRLLQVGLHESQNVSDRMAAARRLLQLLPAEGAALPQRVSSVAVDIRIDLLKFYETHHATADSDVIQSIEHLYVPNARGGQATIHVESSRSPTSILARENEPVLQSVAGPCAVYCFDFDGTLAKIVRHKNAAAMAPTTRRLLGQLAELSDVAIITGRSLDDIRPRLDGIAVRHIIGNHGMEGTGLDLSHYKATIAGVDAHLRRVLADAGKITIENKGPSLSVHYREAKYPDWARQVILKATSEIGGIHVQGGKMVVNITPEGALNKGGAVGYLMKNFGYQRGLYIGDDLTDEDVFIDIARGWLPNFVGVRIGEATDTVAQHLLAKQGQIDPLLQQLIDLRTHWPARM